MAVSMNDAQFKSLADLAAAREQAWAQVQAATVRGQSAVREIEVAKQYDKILQDARLRLERERLGQEAYKGDDAALFEWIKQQQANKQMEQKLEIERGKLLVDQKIPPEVLNAALGQLQKNNPNMSARQAGEALGEIMAGASQRQAFLQGQMGGGQGGGVPNQWRPGQAQGQVVSQQGIQTGVVNPKRQRDPGDYTGMMPDEIRRQRLAAAGVKAPYIEGAMADYKRGGLGAVFPQGGRELEQAKARFIGLPGAGPANEQQHIYMGGGIYNQGKKNLSQITDPIERHAIENDMPKGTVYGMRDGVPYVLYVPQAPLLGMNQSDMDRLSAKAAGSAGMRVDDYINPLSRWQQAQAQGQMQPQAPAQQAAPTQTSNPLAPNYKYKEDPLVKGMGSAASGIVDFASSNPFLYPAVMGANAMSKWALGNTPQVQGEGPTPTVKAYMKDAYHNTPIKSLDAAYNWGRQIASGLQPQETFEEATQGQLAQFNESLGRLYPQTREWRQPAPPNVGIPEVPQQVSSNPFDWREEERKNLEQIARLNSIGGGSGGSDKYAYNNDYYNALMALSRMG